MGNTGVQTKTKSKHSAGEKYVKKPQLDDFYIVKIKKKKKMTFTEHVVKELLLSSL